MESTPLSYYSEFGTIGNLCPGGEKTELTWAQPAYQTPKRGPPSHTYNVLHGSVQETRHFQETTLISEWGGLQRAASPFNRILPKYSHQDVSNIFSVGSCLGIQRDANTEKRAEFHKGRTFLKTKNKVWCKKGGWLGSNNVQSTSIISPFQ